MERCRVGIVIPALNESATIGEVVVVAEKYGVPIVVDDGSSDSTSEIAERYGAIVVTHTINNGYDFALNSGFKKAAELGVEVIITMDADGQHNPVLIQEFIDMINAGADVVVGIRNKRQRFSEHLFAWYTGIRFGIKDPLCGMKAYRRTVYESLGYFDSYGSVGTELMIFAVKNRFKISQSVISVKERKGSSRFGQVLSGNFKIISAMLFSLWKVKKINLSHPKNQYGKDYEKL
ncbi:MAG TPA: glycosyltransferase family 2 protein [Gammaproteobacteria bacterium]|nr:glycosyltransferase family 2 protein [Gammaproteobacteria bacterium]